MGLARAQMILCVHIFACALKIGIHNFQVGYVWGINNLGKIGSNLRFVTIS